MTLDLNCDLGEGEPPGRTEALMREVTSANVACGGHAGTIASMRQCVALAKRFNVRLGAHPGADQSGNFGRGPVAITPQALGNLIVNQIGALQSVAKEEDVPIHHIKLHGALYHAAESNPALAQCYVETVAREFPNAVIFALAGGGVTAAGRKLGLNVWQEAFLDRGYGEDGSLIPRSHPGALLTQVSEVLARLRKLMLSGEILTVTGKPLWLRAQTVCLHSDTPNAIPLAHAVARELRKQSLMGR